jgi:hypothetical protein
MFFAEGELSVIVCNTYTSAIIAGSEDRVGQLHPAA